jgi:hypothetical protein
MHNICTLSSTILATWCNAHTKLGGMLLLIFFCVHASAQRPDQVIPFLVETEVSGEGLDLTFSGRLATFRGEELYTADIWSWDFGDGYSSEGRTTRHSYGSPGRYKLCLNASGSDGRTRYCHMLEVEGESDPDTRPGMQVSYLPERGKLFTWFDTHLGTGGLRIKDSEGEVLWEGPLSIESMEMDVSLVKPGRYTFMVLQPWIEVDRFELEIGE